MVAFIQILSDRKHKGKSHLQMCIKQLALFSFIRGNVSFCFVFSNWKRTGLNCIYPLSITEMCCRLAVFDNFNSKSEGGGQLEKKTTTWVGLWMCSYSIFLSFLLLLKKLPERKGSLGGCVCSVGDSLIRGVHADETYLGRPCVHEAPKLPVLKHRLDVSSVSSAWTQNGCCAFHLIEAKRKEGRGGEGGDCFASFLVGFFFSVWCDGLLQSELYLKVSCRYGRGTQTLLI